MYPLRVTRKKLPLSVVKAKALKISKMIAGKVDPVAILLFGSAADGNATDQSDYDFLVVMESQVEIKPANKAIASLRPLCGETVDIIWMAKKDFIKQRELGGVCLIAWEDGKILYIKPGEREFNR